LVDPQGRGRQHIAARLVQLTGTRAGGFVLTRQEAAGKWGAATYSLVREQGIGTIGTMGIGPDALWALCHIALMPDAVPAQIGTSALNRHDFLGMMKLVEKRG
jgi:hypothetical protein